MRTRGSFFGLLIVTLGCAAACGDDTGTGGLGGGVGGEGVGGTPSGGGSPPVGGEGGTGGDGGAGPQTDCEAICGYFVELEAEVMCGYDGGSCVPECEAGFNNLAEGCEDEAIAYNDCLMAQSADGYNCTNGIFTLTSGACDEPYAALAGCS